MDPEHHFASPHPLGLVGRQNIAPVQLARKRYAAAVSAQPPHALSMLAVGFSAMLSAS
ncbi:hypothetical protein CBM2634_P60003 [Cupriavidus taiwanensis]|uniref:Uncharacterized protein n=1 Tax=Cupriavidus taiwanensis TaxID=164546 RepID=A0A375JFG9_9BURK|nr:hypothetical protein CBM2634_P60003 [Cupriavidus taiwanensis]